MKKIKPIKVFYLIKKNIKSKENDVWLEKMC